MKIRYTAAIAAALLVASSVAAQAQTAGDDTRRIGHGVAEAGRDTGHAVAQTARHVGHAVHRAVHHSRHHYVRHHA